MMKKTLNLCLAMGGGVSLGAFSGAALTEALKLLVIEGKDKDGEYYDEIVLDGMSGASAGSITLTIMMRVLLDYTPYLEMTEVKKYFKLGENATADDVVRVAKNNIRTEYVEVVDNEVNRIEKNIKLLAIIEVAQAVQHCVWVKGLHIQGMLKGASKTLTSDAFGLMSKDFLFDVATTYLIDPLSHGVNTDNKVLLSDRFLMAFSMANLSPSTYSDSPSTSTDSNKGANKDLIDTHFSRILQVHLTIS